MTSLLFPLPTASCGHDHFELGVDQMDSTVRSGHQVVVLLHDSDDKKQYLATCLIVRWDFIHTLEIITRIAITKRLQHLGGQVRARIPPDVISSDETAAGGHQYWSLSEDWDIQSP